MECWLLSETGHNVSDQTSKISQDFLIFMAVYSACRIDCAISSFCGHLYKYKWSVKHSVSWWMTESHRLLSHSVFLARLEYFGIFGIRKVQNDVLNAKRIEKEVSSQWLGSPWCCIVHVCIHMRHKRFHFCDILCKEHLYSAHQYIGESSHSTISVPSQLERQTNSSKDFEGNGKDKFKICIRQVYWYLC